MPITANETSILKGLIAKGLNQTEALHWINLHRSKILNHGRVKKALESETPVASPEEVDRYLQSKLTTDVETGLNPLEHQRLVRSREAMIMAVRSYNDPSQTFRTPPFTIFGCIAFLYLHLAALEQNNESVFQSNGKKLIGLTECLNKNPLNLSQAQIINIRHIQKIRDECEHDSLVYETEQNFPIFLSFCINYEKIITQIFGNKCSISSQLGHFLQFRRFGLNQILEAENSAFPITQADFREELTEEYGKEIVEDQEFMVRVKYSLTTSPQASTLNIEFTNDENREAHTVLLKNIIPENTFKFSMTEVITLVNERSRNSKPFNQHFHTLAAKEFCGRKTRSQAVNSQYGHFFAVGKTFGYNEAWVKFLVEYWDAAADTAGQGTQEGKS